ncbi:MAG: aminotransferase class IV [Nitrospiraceae bacterium]|nr:aminotransferase class IV [Nitrospiraceae bacterium]
MDESAGIYLNDRVVPLAQARVSVLDHGFLYGDGVYETMRVYGGVVFMMEEHLARLENSASLIELRLPKSPRQMKLAIYETLEACGHKDAYLRVTVSRGEGPIGLDPELCPRPTFFVYAGRLTPPSRDYYEEGITLAVANTRRNLREALDPQIKSLNFLNNIRAKIEAKKAGAHEALMLNHRGHLAEGTTSNIFFVSEGALLTPGPECGILRGITRDTVLAMARRMDMKVVEGEFTEEDLLGSSEAFITSTIMEVVPVSRLIGAPSHTHTGIRDFHGVGDITKALMAEYRKEVFSYVQNTRAAGPSIWGFTE